MDNNNSTATPYVNGVAQNTKTGTMPTLTGLTLGAQASGGQPWNGPIGEILIFSTKLSDTDRQKIEGYLGHKWGLSSKLASSHPYYLGAPVSASGTPDYIADTPFGSGKSIDLKDGHVEIPTGESEDDFDGGSSFSVSAWVKGWPGKSMDTIVSKGGVITADPSSASGMIAWFDAADTFTYRQGFLPRCIRSALDGEVIGFMLDKSGRGNHCHQKVG